MVFIRASLRAVVWVVFEVATRRPARALDEATKRPAAAFEVATRRPLKALLLLIASDA